MAEDLVRRYPRPWTIIRPTIIYGERDRNLLPRAVGALRSGWMGLIDTGEQKLNIMYAGDVAEAAVLAATHSAAVGEAYNVTSEGEITQKQLCDMMTDFLGMKPITVEDAVVAGVPVRVLVRVDGGGAGDEEGPLGDAVRPGVGGAELPLQHGEGADATGLGTPDAGGRGHPADAGMVRRGGPRTRGGPRRWPRLPGKAHGLTILQQFITFFLQALNRLLYSASPNPLPETNGGMTVTMRVR